MKPNGHRSSVLLADDHQMIRQGLGRLLGDQPDIEVVAEAANGHQVLEALRRIHVDVVVCDLSMPGLPAMDLIKRIRTRFPKVAVLVLSMYPEDPWASRAFRSGAHGFLTKESAAEQLVQAIRKVAAGGAFVSGSLAEHLAMGLGRPDDGPRHAQLSDREFEVFRHLTSGRRMTETARQMHLSIKTVSTHKARIMEKLGVDSLAALVRYSIEQGLFDPAAGNGHAQGGQQLNLPLQG